MERIEFMRCTISLCRTIFITKLEGSDHSDLDKIFDELHQSPSWTKVRYVLKDAREQLVEYKDVGHPILDRMAVLYGEMFSRFEAKDWDWFRERSVRRKVW